MWKRVRNIIILVAAILSAFVAGAVSWNYTKFRPIELKTEVLKNINQESEFSDLFSKSEDEIKLTELPVEQRISFTVRNVVMCYAFLPGLSLMDVMSQINKLSKIEDCGHNLRLWECINKSDSVICSFHIYRCIAGWYAFIIFLAPICTASTFYVVLGNIFKTLFLHLSFFFRPSSTERVLLVGDSRSAKTIVDNELELENRRKIIYVTTREISKTEKLDLLKKRVKVVTLPKMDLSQEEFRKELKRLSRKGIQGIILCEESGASNFTLYQILMEKYRGYLNDDTLCCCRCGNETIRKLFDKYYMANRGEKQKKCIAPILFSVSDMRVYSMLNNLPIPMKVSESGTEGKVPELNLLIGGFGKTGRKFLQEAVMMGTCSSNSVIHIDVVDIDIKKKKDELLRVISHDIFEIKDNTYTLIPRYADGSLSITFHEMDVAGSDFMTLLNEYEYDYVSLCIENVDVCVQSILQMDRIRSIRNNNFRIVVSWLSDPEISVYLEKDYSPTFISGTKQFLNADYILYKSIEAEAKHFHNIYREIALDNVNPVKDWEELEIFKQVDNRSLSRHQSVKKVLIADTAEQLSISDKDLLQRYFGSKGSIARKYDGNQSEGIVFKRCGTVADTVQKINDDAFLREMGMIEHRRWCYARALTGWRYTETKNDDLKESMCLVTWDELCEKNPEYCLYDVMPLMMQSLE